MRIAGIRIQDHPGIGNLFLDFRGLDGKAPRFVVIAGENGCGKTIVLEAIFAALIPMDLLLNLPRIHTTGSVRIYVEHDFSDGSLMFSGRIDEVLFRETRAMWPEFRGVVIDLDWSIRENGIFWRSISSLENNTADYGILNPSAQLGQDLGSFFSVANTAFDVAPIRSVTAMSNPARVGVEASESYPLFGAATLASKIPQLLVDLESADGIQATRWYREHPGTVMPEELVGSRIKRFTEAFERLIPQKRFRGIEVVEGQLIPMFSENGRSTPIANLSTGEKQIVFRGAFLLQHAEHMPGSIVMIDEPELSLHPNWQSGILDFYDRIVAETDQLNSQIILATHSPFVVHGSPSAKHIILRRDSHSGTVSIDPTPSYRGITSGEIAIAAFDLVDISFGQPESRLVVVTEGKTDALIIATAWQKLRPNQPMPFHLVPAGGAKSIMNLLGTGPTNPGWLYATFEGRNVDRYLALYDFDDPGYGQWNGLVSRDREDVRLNEAECISCKRSGKLLWAALLPVPEYRTSIASLTLGDASMLAIELLFPDEFLESKISKSPVASNTATYIFEAKEREKVPFAFATAEFPPRAFEAFQPLFRLCDRIISA